MLNARKEQLMERITKDYKRLTNENRCLLDIFAYKS